MDIRAISRTCWMMSLAAFICPVANGVPIVTLTATLGGPPEQVQIAASDSAVGLSSIVVSVSTNATTSVPAFAIGTTNPVVVTATKINQSQAFDVSLTVRNVNGDTTNFVLSLLDNAPVITLLTLPSGSPRQFEIEVVDNDFAGLASISVTQSTNLITTVPAFTIGTMSPVDITDTQVDQVSPFVVSLSATDLDGLSTDATFAFNADGTLQGAPEPATLALLGIGLAGLGYSRRQRKQ